MGSPGPNRSFVEAVGAKAMTGASYAGGLAILIGSAFRWAARGIFSSKVRLGREALAGQMVRVGVRSVGIVILVQLFIGVILALQMTPPLKEPWGQEAQVSRIIGVAGFRMLGPIITAVVLSGFAGASIAAELGTMVVSEEIEAMESIALNPIRFLVVPRVLATLVVMVLLTVIADLMIALGGWFTSRLVLGPTSYMGYWTRMQEQLKYRDFITGLIQSAVFGLLIAAIACYEGLKVRGGAEGVGRATTMTVVYSIVAIVSAACVCTVIFYTFGL
jgi:phospholipid/cholesterol/gamma-HCH transport system permease protein